LTVIKNQKSNTYEVRTYYKDWTGVRKQKTKRGFKRKCDAQEWERAFKLKENLSLDMYFEDFVDLYLNDIKSRIKYNTWLTKKHIVEKKILPYFSKKKLQEIKPSDIRQWQNTMMNYRNKQGEGYSQVYLKTIHNQLSAILNHAVNFYDLKSNAARKAGSMGKERTKEMLFWTKEEYMKFIEAVADKPISFYAFEILYWCGVRMGDDDDKIRLNQRKPSKYKGLRRFGPEKNLQRINKFMKERPIFYKNLIQMKENIRFYLRCFYCITKVMILQFNSENRTELARNG
jgi:integrase